MYTNYGPRPNRELNTSPCKQQYVQTTPASPPKEPQFTPTDYT